MIWCHTCRCFPLVFHPLCRAHPRSRCAWDCWLAAPFKLFLCSTSSRRSTATASTSTSPCPVDCSPTARKTNTTTPSASRSEHGRVPGIVRPKFNLRSHSPNLPQHVWYDKVSHVASSNVHLLKMRDTSVAGGHRDVLQLHVHIVLGCRPLTGVCCCGCFKGAPSISFPR